MSVIAKAIADRQSEIERLQAEIKALNDVDKIHPSGGRRPRPPRRRTYLSEGSILQCHFCGRSYIG